MADSYGIQQTKDILNYGNAVADELIKAKADGVITVAEAVMAFHNTRKELLIACFGAWAVPYEMGDLTEAEAAELRDQATQVFSKFISLFYPFPTPTRALATLGAGSGIRETMEVLQFFSAFGDCLIEAKKDGKITVQEVIDSFKKTQNDFFNAAWNAWMIPIELKDLDETEARMLSEKVAQVATKWIEIFTV